MWIDGRTALKAVVVRYGDGIGEDRNRLRSLLHDYCCPKREVMLLVHAAELGVVRALRGAGGDTTLVFARLTQLLHDDYGVDIALAGWAIESWAEGLGVAVSGSRLQATVYRSSAAPQVSSPHQQSRQQTPVALSAGISMREAVTGMKFVWIPPGEFMMGSNDGSSNEKPVHRVAIRKGFWMGKFAVTQGELESVMGNNPSYFKGDPRLPVESISWHDVQDFIRKVNSRTGKRFRLPSEAEWEYACRAGTTTRYSFGDNEIALNQYGWFEGNSGGRTHPVGEKLPNDWGLYDMHGNLWEWCEDCWNANYRGGPNDAGAMMIGDCSSRVVRGGSWIFHGRDLRSAYRNGLPAVFRNGIIGFRLIQDN